MFCFLLTDTSRFDKDLNSVYIGRQTCVKSCLFHHHSLALQLGKVDSLKLACNVETNSSCDEIVDADLLQQNSNFVLGPVEII